MKDGRKIMIGNTVITAKIARQLMPKASIATHETDDHLRTETFSQGMNCAQLRGSLSDCPWISGITAKWWKEGFDYALKLKGGAQGAKI